MTSPLFLPLGLHDDRNLRGDLELPAGLSRLAVYPRPSSAINRKQGRAGHINVTRHDRTDEVCKVKTCSSRTSAPAKTDSENAMIEARLIRDLLLQFERGRLLQSDMHTQSEEHP